MKRIRYLLVLAIVWIYMLSSCLPSGLTISENKDSALVAIEEEDDHESNLEGDSRPEEPFNSEIFFPTREWQTIKPGQAIPKGLHVRVNLETGLKEAKLMEGDDGMKYWKKGDRRGMVNTDRNSFTVKEIKKALKEFKVEDDDVQDEEMKKEALRKNYKRYDELKEDFKKLNMNAKTENEILNELVLSYRDPKATIEEKEHLLDSLEYYLHQIDNGQDFAKMGGIELLMKDLNHTAESVRLGVALVLGACLQSNPKVQIQALEAGLLQHLIRLVANEKSQKLRQRFLYALSSLVRQFPFAQKRFLQLGGVHVITDFLKEKDTSKLKLKGATLISDLLQEQQSVIEHSETYDEEKVKQYKEVSLLEALIEQNWCEWLPKLLEFPEHDSREKILNAMTMLLKPCKNQFNLHFNRLSKLQLEYKILAAEETDDDYFSSLYSVISHVIDTVTVKDEL